VERVLYRMAAMRSYMRDVNLGREPREGIANAVAMTGDQIQEMYRLLAIAKYEERYVIPVCHVESAHDLEGIGTDCPLNAPGGPGMNMSLPEESLGMAGPGYATKRQSTPVPTPDGVTVNLLNWDGKGRPGGMFPQRAAGAEGGA
jgi:nitrate reductase beta subunit